MFKKWGFVVLFCLAALTAAAQSTRVRGLVTDASTGEPLPFAGVYFDGTTIGISTDLDGRYSLETRSKDARVLTAQLIGYESQSVSVNTGSFSEINFALKPDPRQLEAALVKPDNRYIKSVLKKLDEARAKHDPENAPDWQVGLYTKIELDVTNLEDFLKLGPVNRNLGFVMDYADTSAITGKAFVPAMISENVSDLYHSQSPSFQREVMRASRISGLDEDNFLRQFSGSYLLKPNFYKSSIGVFNLVIPNPAAASSHFLYNYFLVDSLQVEGRKTYVLRFHPKKLVTSPSLDGEMQIDAEDFGIRSVHAQLSHSSNVNWIRHINMDVENRRLPDGRWFFYEEHMFLDLSITLDDNSNMLSLLARRHSSYQMPVFKALENRKELSASNDVVMRDAVRGDDAYWEQARPYPLSEREQGIYKMVEDIQSRPFYKWTYTILDTFITGYYDPGFGFEFGRWARAIVHNDTEGLRIQLGGRTTKDFSERIRLGGYLAYGFKDEKFKGQFTTEIMFQRERTRKLTLDYKRDFVQLGSGEGVFSAPNIFSSIIARNHANRQTMVKSAKVTYQHEFNPSVNAQLLWESKRMWSNVSVPIYAPDGSHTVMEFVDVHQLHTALRFSYDERVNRNYFRKTYLFTKFPVLEVGLTGGFKGISANDVDFLRLETLLKWRVPSTIVGFGTLQLNGGIILGSVPHPLMKLHEGNQTYFLDKKAFACMNYYEFASDRWISGYYEHNFNGFILSKIPLLKELDLREVGSVHFAWGDISEQNLKNTLPETSALNTPYVEAGFGVSNILRVLRVDCFWRLTHRLPEAKNNFSISLGIDIEF